MLHRLLRTVILPACVALTLAAPLPGQTVKMTAKPGQDPARFRKYSWRESKLAARQNPENIARMDRSIRDSVNRQLLAKGYVEDAQAPEFYVQVLGVGTPEATSSANANLDWSGNNETWNSSNPSGAGVQLWMAVVSEFSLVVTEGQSGAEIWRAVVSKKYKDPEKAMKNLDREVEDVMGKALKDFPKRKPQ